MVKAEQERFYVKVRNRIIDGLKTDIICELWRNGIKVNLSSYGDSSSYGGSGTLCHDL